MTDSATRPGGQGPDGEGPDGQGPHGPTPADEGADDIRLIADDSGSPIAMTLRRAWGRTLPDERTSELAGFCREWNEATNHPQLETHSADSGRVGLVAEVSVDLSGGVAPGQFEPLLSGALAACAPVFDRADRRFPEALARLT